MAEARITLPDEAEAGTYRLEIEGDEVRTLQCLKREKLEPVAAVPWQRDIRAELARRDDCAGILANGWWQRALSDIDGLTIHHTLSHDPWATTEHYLQKDIGRPSIPYHIWVTSTGEVLLCLDFWEGCWHDHTGHRNTHLSVGLAGSLHLYAPPIAQVQAAAHMVAWAINEPEMSITLEGVKGHRDYYAGTICPGWHERVSGHWEERFWQELNEELGP